MSNAANMKVVLSSKAALSDGVTGLTLRDPSGVDLPSWEPGSHIDMELPNGLIRQYSLCGDPAERSAWRVAVLREAEGRGGSSYVHDSLHEGDLLTVRGIRDQFPLVPAPRYLFIAGGIGITPILPMVARASAEGAEWRLLYGGRTRASMAFLPELEAYGDRVVVAPQDEVGLLDLAAWLAEPRDDTHIYCCGPEPLLDAVEQLAARWPAGALQVERFRPTAVAPAGPGESFDVELASSGTALSVPADRSILDVLEEAGVDVLWSCREGTCGTCETGVLEGVPDHRDSLLVGSERETTEYMYVCVSRALSPRLVLDL